ncbi:MAG: hypothetical protein HY898_13180 [Deltaproteobacteria bacterium]|nr:hypothetical protein [Deltaproteobacteria bacterium]
MRSLRAIGSMAVACALACACSSSSEQQPIPDAAVVPETGPVDKATSIAFEPDAMLTLAPGEKTTLQIVVQPTGVHSVRFSLVGDSLDASLDADLLQTTELGRAAVVLTAPQAATAFQVRAVADDGPSAQAVVSVSGTGFAKLTVVPAYAGARSTPEWTATAAALISCSDKKGIPPQDGPLMQTAPSGSPLVLDGLPAGPKLAITLRSGHAVGGCSDLVKLSAGEERTVSVKVGDRPIELASTDFELGIVLEPDGTALEPWLEASTAKFVEAFAPKGNEAAALLDAMQSLAPVPAEFAKARLNGKWDEAAVQYLQLLGKPLSERIHSWAAKGFLPLRGGVGLTGRIRSTQESPSQPALTVETFGGLDAAKVGWSYDYMTSLSADPGDTVHVAGAVYVLPTAYVAAAVDSATASAEVPDGLSALRHVVSCSKLADALATTTLPPTCLMSCIEKLCMAGVGRMWETARDASEDSFDAASLSFNVSAAAQVDAEAVIVTMAGTWAGEFTSGQDDVSVKGTATGTAPPSP